MSAKVYTINKASWITAMGGKSDVTINTITEHSFMVGGPVQTFHSDGDIYSQFAWMENIVSEVDLTYADYSLMVGANSLAIGDVGQLALQFPELGQGVSGKNAGAGLTLKALCGNDGSTQDDGCLIAAHRPAATQTGAGPGKITFALNSVDGATSPIQISMETLA